MTAAQLERRGRYMVVVRYLGSPRPWIALLGDLVVRHLPGDGGGVLHITRCAEVGRRLRAGGGASRGRGAAPIASHAGAEDAP